MEHGAILGYSLGRKDRLVYGAAGAAEQQWTSKDQNVPQYRWRECRPLGNGDGGPPSVVRLDRSEVC